MAPTTWPATYGSGASNRTGDLRLILGGAWSEPDYLYRSTDAADPYDRLLINGFRCMRTRRAAAGCRR